MKYMKQRSKQIHTSIHAYLHILHLGLIDVTKFTEGPAGAVCRIYPNLGNLCFLGRWSDHINHPQRDTYAGEVTDLSLHTPIDTNYYNLSWVLTVSTFYER